MGAIVPQPRRGRNLGRPHTGTSIQIPAEADEATAKGIALEDAKVKDFTAGKQIKKVIYVKGRILNLIVG